MVNVELGNEMRKMNYSTWHERGTKKISESPTGIEPVASGTHATTLSTELRELMVSKVI